MVKSMNICLVHEEYPSETNFGGIATYQKITAEEYVRQGNNVIVICRSLTDDYEYTENGVKVYRLSMENKESKLESYTLYREKVAALLLKLQSENKIDIIEVPDWGAETVLFEKDRKVPLVVRLHTPLKVWLNYNKSDFGDVTEQMLKWENDMLLKANLVTCCSQALKDIICEEFEIAEEKIIVTPNPANITNFSYDASVIKDNTIIFVGSLEERKGVLILAHAINQILSKYPEFKVQFIGKDTTRNNQNISTIQYIKNIVEDRFLQNLEFKGQLENSELNYYLNKACVGVFPSIFDNFPYTVLESMSTGLQIVGSKNSGMREMLKDEKSLYISGDSKDLADKVIDKIELAKLLPINYENIETVNREYNSDVVCGKMLKMYKETVRGYDLTVVLQTIFPNKKIDTFSRETMGVANEVYNVKTNTGEIYIIKKYTRNVNFFLSDKLYDLYEENGVGIIKPINAKAINVNDSYYNVFEYVKRDDCYYISREFLTKLLLCNRKVELEENLMRKCNFFFNTLRQIGTVEGVLDNELNVVLNTYDGIKDLDLFKESYLNHGDISSGNILASGSKMYLIDFDETLVSSMLYDFAVVIIKLCVVGNKIKKVDYEYFKEEIQKQYNYTDDDFCNAVKFYLCKILLEKFYLHHTKQIDLFSERQQSDKYEKYLKILYNFDKGEFYG